LLLTERIGSIAITGEGTGPTWTLGLKEFVTDSLEFGLELMNFPELEGEVVIIWSKDIEFIFQFQKLELSSVDPVINIFT
jgi:hypothetical protein